MDFPTRSSPYLPPRNDVGRLMADVMLALIPGALALIWFFGWGTLFNLLLATTTAVGAEALMLGLRRRPVAATLRDGSAILTGLLLGLALPPLTPWWIPVVGALFAIVVAKQLYGGLGYNPFNPAMVGFVVLIISFPLQMTLWPPPRGMGQELLTFLDTLRLVFTGALPAGLTLDGVTTATPLDAYKTGISLNLTGSEILSGPLFGSLAGRGWEWVNGAFLAGGLWMLARRTIHWQIPAGMLGTLFLMALLFYIGDADSFGSPLLHLFSGATMLGAFFIATDPVSASTTPRGRLYYGAGIGLIVYVIRCWGGYPDGVAFAVLLMNMAAPTLDYYTQPRVFGHGESD
ncbi:MAG TPA: electron transport complex subunit RsxD [Gammaproteobacteria bacterium]|nr:electron transport complex subunit RsxD [Gammaproteobacteria bacterium]